MVIQLVILLIVVGFLAFEFFQYKKNHSAKSHPEIPQFDKESTAPGITTSPSVIPTKSSMSPLMLLTLPVFGIIAIGAVFLSGAFSDTSAPAADSQANVVVEEIPSQGIKIYSADWQELKGTMAAELKSGETLYCAIETIPNADIDRARIRINTTAWNLEDITQQFNKSLRVYYRECNVATGEAKLKIDAQLHSARDGWLGE